MTTEPLSDYAHFKVLPAEERDALGFKQWQWQSRIGTHDGQCWNYGPAHWQCAMNRIAELEQQLVAEAAKTAAEKLRADQMTEQHRMQAAMHAQATERVSALEASRIAYASEFELNADGEPDVGSIHANIRALKSQLSAPRQCLHGISEPSGWRDIATAPRGGVKFIALIDGITYVAEYDEYGRFVRYAHRNRRGMGRSYRLHQIDGKEMREILSEGEGDNFEVVGLIWSRGFDHQPTAWLPLPPSPSSADEGGSNG